MRFTTYSKYHPELADAVNLQGLLDQLGDFLLQSGFAGGSPSFRSLSYTAPVRGLRRPGALFLVAAGGAGLGAVGW